MSDHASHRARNPGHVYVSEDHDSAGSIVEHPENIGESPQWRNCVRSPSEILVRDSVVQTEDQDNLYLLKSAALEELEEDIVAAQGQLSTLGAAISTHEMQQEVRSLRSELFEQKQITLNLQSNIRYLASLVEKLVVDSQASSN